MFLPLFSRPAFSRSSITRIIQWFCALSILSGSLPGAEVSRQPPAVYEEKVVRLLTPVAAITVPRERAKDDNASGITLLDERIHFVEPDGRRVVVWHLAYKAFTEAGAKSCAEDVFTYLRGDQKFHLVTAETIQPDGTVLPVRANALLVQSPQRQADYALYDDQEEVKIIFPNVKEGSITRVIAVIEDTQVRMPGEYAHDFTWTSTWATVRVNYLVDLPAVLAERLRVHTLGADVPAYARSEPVAGRVRLQWDRTEIPALRYEPGRAPARQVGPAIQLSTIASWAEVGRWFGGLFKGRDQLSPLLMAKVDAWTKDLKTREEIIRTLLAQVANNVRYTGLELGQAAYQPHDCNEVWENQYGDCKDKANLLAAFLQHKGIDARVALVNTRHLGLIDRRSPDYGAFTHAITAIADGKGGYEFCDPTIAFCAPGMIGPGSADRDVLVVTGSGGEWVRTPSQNAGSVAYEFDLELDATGELSGWMTVKADGYYGAGQRERYRKRDADETRRRLTDWVRGFFPGAEVMDAVKVNPEAESGPDVLKAYFIVSARQDQSDGRRTLTFPHGGWMLPDLGTSAQRDSTYFLQQDIITLKMAIKLPEGLNVQARPEPYQFETPTGRAGAHWEFAGRTGRAELAAEITQPALTAQEFGRYYQAVQSMEAWLEKPVVLAMDSSVKAVETKNAAKIDLPLMPTGEGQISLVEKRHPYEGNHALRRAALERTLQYFPNDKNTVFQAQVRLGFLDWAADNNEQALERVRPLLTGYGSVVNIHDFAWAAYLEALALRDLKRPEEALAVLKRLAGDPALTPFRRSNAVIAASDILEGQADTAGAVELLSGGLELDPDKQTATYQRLVRLLIVRGDVARAKAVLSELVDKHPGQSTEVITSLAKDALTWAGTDVADRQKALHETLVALVPVLEEAVKTALAELRARQRILEVSIAIQAELRKALAKPSVAAWYKPSGDKSRKVWADFESAIAAAEKAGDSASGTQLSVEALMSLPVDEEFPGHLERATGQAEWLSQASDKETPEIFVVLLDLCDRLPKENHSYIEARFWRARWLARTGDAAGERRVYEGLLAGDYLPPVFATAAHGRLGKSLENAGDFAGALACYAKLEAQARESASAADFVLRGVFIHLHQKRTKEALRLIAALGEVPEEVLAKTKCEKQIREFVALAKAGAAEKFWIARREWWPKWTALLAGEKLPVDDPSEVAPVIENLTDLGRELGQAQRANDRKTFFRQLNRLASACRWLPAYAPELPSLQSVTAKLMPDRDRLWRECMIAMLEIPVPVGVAGEGERQVQLAANLVDNQKAARALKVIEAFRNVSRPEDETSRSMIRVWAYAALAAAREREACAAALETYLADPAQAGRRAKAVELLASLYRALGRSGDEDGLLRREMLNTHVIADADGRKELQNRLSQLSGSRQLAGQVDAWIKEAGLDWLDHVEPQSLSDPKLRDLDEVLKNPQARFSPPSVVKLQLLVARDANRSLAAQQQAWSAAVAGCLAFCQTRPQSMGLVDDFIGRGQVPEDLRAYVLWLALCDAFSERWSGEFSRWQKHPLTERFNALQKKSLPMLARGAKTERGDADALLALAEELRGDEIGIMERMVIYELTVDLLGMGEIEVVKRLADTVPDWQLAGSVAGTHGQIQLDLAQRIRAAELAAPVHEALTRKTLEKFSDVPRQLPSAYAELRKEGLARMPWYSNDETRDAALYLIKMRRFSRGDLGFWLTFLRSLHENEGGEAFAFELCEAALAACDDDGMRAQVAGLLGVSVDLDQEAVRKRAKKIWAPYRDAQDAPETRSRIRVIEVQLGLRTGQPVDFATCFTGVQEALLPYIRTRLELTHALQQGDDATLRRLVAERDGNLLLNPLMVGLSLRVFERLGMKAESKLARDACRKELRGMIGASWATMNRDQFSFIPDLAQALNESDMLPGAWLDAVRTRLAEPRERHEVLLTAAWLRRDWAAVTKESDVLIGLNPSRFDLYWYRGMAATEAGRRDDSIRALTTFVTYSKDHLDYPEAVRMLEKLKLAGAGR